MFQHILVPLDGSLHAERAIPIAARIARASEGMVILLRVVQAGPKYEPESGASPFQATCQSTWEEAQLYLTRITSSRSLAGLPLQVLALQGPLVESTQMAIHMYQADLLVCCEQPLPHGSHDFLSTFAEQLSLHLSIPLFFLPAQDPPRVPPVEPAEPLTCLVAFTGPEPEPFLVHPATALLAALSQREPGRLHFLPLHSIAAQAMATTGNQRVASRQSAVSLKGSRDGKKPERRATYSQHDVFVLSISQLMEYRDSLQEMCTHPRLLVPAPDTQH